MSLAFILLMTFILAVKQLYPFNSIDEVEILTWIKDLNHDAFPSLKYPSLFIYLHYVLSWLYAQVLCFLGIIPTTTGFLSTEMGFRFTMEAGRLLNGIIATGTVYWVYKMGRDFYSHPVGLTGAAVLACNPLFLSYAHIFKPEIPVTFLLTAAVYYLLKYLDTFSGEKSLRYLFYASLFFGLAMACKYNAFPLGVVFIVVFFLVRDKRGPKRVEKTWKKKWLIFPLGVLSGFLLASPNWIFNPLGNIKKMLMQYTPQDGFLFKQFEPKSVLEIYRDFSLDYFIYFGVMVGGIFVIGLMVGFLTRKKKDFILSFYIVCYMLLFAAFGYYAARFALPVFPVAALLVGKVLFIDTKFLLKKIKLERWEYLSRVGMVLLAVFITGYVWLSTVDNVRNYNLLKTQSSWERTIEYGEQHNLVGGGVPLGRQVHTPKVKGNSVKITKHFHVKGGERYVTEPIPFIQAELTIYEEALKKEKGREEKGVVDLTAYKPFYTIKERAYQTWNPGCIFLYRVSPDLFYIQPGNGSIEFPRPYYESGHTSFLPLQTYEKNPNFGILKGERYHHWIKSSRAIEKLTFWIFSLHWDRGVVLRVNDVEKVVTNENGLPIQRVEMEGLERKRFYHDYVYEIEMDLGQELFGKKPYYLAWEPVYEDEGEAETRGKKGVKFARSARGAIPALFSGKKYPLWARLVYKETGVDLSLLEYVSRHALLDNGKVERGAQMVRQNMALDFTAVEQGSYYVRVEAEPVFPQYPLGGEVFIECTYYTLSGGQRERVRMSGKGVKVFPLEVKDRIAFVKISMANLKENNYLVKQISIIPNYHWYFNMNLVEKSQDGKRVEGDEGEEEGVDNEGETGH